MWGPAWIKIHWSNTWLRVRSHMASHYYTWGSVTTWHDFGGVLGRPFDTFFWAPTVSWSRLLARVWSGPYYYAFIYVMGENFLRETSLICFIVILLRRPKPMLTSTACFYNIQEDWLSGCMRSNERGEPAVSSRWTGWVWEITGWSSRLQENYWSF